MTCRSTVGDSTFCAAGKRMWNSLPPDVKLLPSLPTVRCHLKTVLLLEATPEASLALHVTFYFTVTCFSVQCPCSLLTLHHHNQFFCDDDDVVSEWKRSKYKNMFGNAFWFVLWDELTSCCTFLKKRVFLSMEIKCVLISGNSAAVTGEEGWHE